MFYRAVRAACTPSVFVRQPLTTDAEADQIRSVLKIRNAIQLPHVSMLPQIHLEYKRTPRVLCCAAPSNGS